ncbi:MAG: hypothetical protein Q4E22_06555 [Coriobacteriia bacterium]|nr:hypothetical protein [Coriobacteriia bacterium]
MSTYKKKEIPLSDDRRYYMSKHELRAYEVKQKRIRDRQKRWKIVNEFLGFLLVAFLVYVFCYMAMIAFG